MRKVKKSRVKRKVGLKMVDFRRKRCVVYLNGEKQSTPVEAPGIAGIDLGRTISYKIFVWRRRTAMRKRLKLRTKTLIAIESINIFSK